MEQIAIRTDQLTKQFGDRIAVNKLNLEIRLFSRFIGCFLLRFQKSDEKNLTLFNTNI
jgi:hypothetical protein